MRPAPPQQTIRFGRVVVRGAFPPGTAVRLVEAADRHVTHSAGGLVVAERTVDETGTVDFPDVQIGPRYFVVGRVEGQRLELPASAHDDAFWDGVPRTRLPRVSVVPPVPHPPEPTAPDGSPWLMISSGASRYGGPGSPAAPAPGGRAGRRAQRAVGSTGIATPIDPADAERIRQGLAAR
jgi:hypothetical protein